MHVRISCTHVYGCAYGRENPPRDKQVAKPEPDGERRRAVLKESWSRSNEEWDRTVLCKGYRQSSGGEQRCSQVPAPSTEKREPNADRRESAAASGDQKHPKPFEKGCFLERLISTLPKRSLSPSACTDHYSLTTLQQTRRTLFLPV